MKPPPMSEEDLQIRIVEYARLLGLLVYHPYDSRRSTAGFPDLTIVGKRILFAELKSEGGRVTPDQQKWLNGIRIAGGESAAVIWRPSDWDVIVATLKELRH